MRKSGLRRKVAALVISTGLVTFNIPVFASQTNSSNGGAAANLKVSGTVDSSKESKAKKYKEGEVIVKFKGDRNVKSLGQATTRHSLKVKKNLDNATTQLLTFAPNSSMDQVLKDLKSSDQVEYAEPNYIRKAAAVSDPKYGQQWGFRNTGQSILGEPGKSGIDIKAEMAWSRTKGSTSVVVGVVDSGIDINHPDLKDRIWKNTKEVAGDGIDNDKNGYVDDVNGWDFANNNKSVYDSATEDDHGTHVAGTIGATNNSTGVIGVAPNVKVMPLKFLTADGGYIADEVEAINYAKARGVKIINMSIGGYGFSQAEYDAIKSAYNTLFVVASGNEYNNNDGSDPSYPAGYTLANILSVAAVDNSGNFPSWSNYGVKSTDLAAPGVDILSTVPGNSYDYYSGTSMATPHVTGTAALVLSLYPSFNPSTIKTYIMKSTTPLSSLKGKVYTGGMLNTGRALYYEPNDDIPGTAFTGTSRTGTVSSSTDLHDVYSIKLLKGEKVKVTLSGATGTDFNLNLFNSSAKTVKSTTGLVEYSRNSNTSSETLYYIAPANGTYYVDVQAVKGAGKYTASIRYGATAGTYENTAREIGYFGTWGKTSTASAYGGSYAIANQLGAKAQFVFNGTAIYLKGVKGPSSGYVKVTLDGVSTTVNLYSTSVLYKQQYFAKSGLSAGRHVVTIEWTGKGVKTTATKVNLDAIVVK